MQGTGVEMNIDEAVRYYFMCKDACDVSWPRNLAVCIWEKANNTSGSKDET